LFSALLGLVVVPGCLAFGAFFVVKFRLLLNVQGYALTAIAWIFGPAEIVESVLTLLGTDSPRTLHALATLGGLSAFVWFSVLNFWPRLLVRGVRPNSRG
jgi:hypothetical protein